MDSSSETRKFKRARRKREHNKTVNNNEIDKPKNETKPNDTNAVSFKRPQRKIVKAKEKIEALNKKFQPKINIENADSSNTSKGTKLQPRNSKISFSISSNKVPSSTNVLNAYQKEVLKKRQERLEKTSKSTKKSYNSYPEKPNNAEKRMKVLRKRLSDEIEDEVNPNKMETVQDDSIDKYPPLKRARTKKDVPCQNMEVDVIVDVINQARFNDGYKINNTAESIVSHHFSFSQDQNSDVDLIVVVDTNILLSHISMIDEISNYHSHTLNVAVMIPWRVLGELDSLKNNEKVVDNNIKLGHLARKAVSYLHENLPKNPRLLGQSLKEAYHHLYPCNIPDDEILNCCLQVNSSNDNVLLLSNDKNLCNKALANNIKSCSHSTIRSYLSSCDSAKTDTLNKSKSINNTPVSKPSIEKESKASSVNLKLSNAGVILKDFLSVVLEEEMKFHYEELWERIILHKPPWSIQDIFDCILRHWIAVFSDIFTRSALDTAKELKFHFPRRRSNKQLTESDMKLFISSCVKFLQPLKTKFRREYSKLVDNCCVSLNKLIDIETAPNCSYKFAPDDTDKKFKPNDRNEKLELSERLENSEPDEKSEYIMDCTESNVDQIFSFSNSNTNYSFVEIEIFDMFQFIWRSLNNYCSLLANSLDVEHCFEDKISKSNLDFLIAQADSVANQINLLIENMSRTLMSNSVDENSPEYMKCEANKAIDSFYQVLIDTIQGMNRNKPNFDNVQLFNFSTKHRKLLEDGFEKFTILKNLMRTCGEKFANLSNRNCNIFS